MQTNLRTTMLRSTLSGGLTAALIAGTAVMGAPALAAPTRSEAASTATVTQRLMCPYKALGEGTWVKRYPGGPRVEWWPGGQVRYVPSPPVTRKNHIKIGANKWVRAGTIARISGSCV